MIRKQRGQDKAKTDERRGFGSVMSISKTKGLNITIDYILL
jgi:hypothetical protein